jgi:hypothetical protein
MLTSDIGTGSPNVCACGDHHKQGLLIGAGHALIGISDGAEPVIFDL